MYKKLIQTFFIIFMSGCATNPVSGIPDFVTITEQQEISIGALIINKYWKKAK